MKYLILMIFAFIFNGCSPNITYIDVSNEEKYSKIIGKTFKTLKPLRLTANLVDDYKSKVIWSYTISETGFAGRYVLWNKKLLRGTLITINKILKYDSVIIDDFTLRVYIKDIIFNDNLPIDLYSTLTKTTKDGKYIIMNSKYFQEVKLDK